MFKRFSPNIVVNLYKKGELVQSYSSPLKTRVSHKLLGLVAAERNYDVGVCRITYSARKSVYNEFEFKNAREFRAELAPCVEQPLLDFIQGGVWA